MTSLSATQRSVLNTLLVQCLWFACLAGGTRWAWPALAVHLCLHQCVIGKIQHQWRSMLAITTIGLGADTLAAAIGILHWPSAPWLPSWMVALWIGFSTLFVHGLSWLRTRPLLAALCGAIGGPCSYYSGAHWQTVPLGVSVLSFVLIYAILWAALTPLFGKITHTLMQESAHDSVCTP